MIHSCNTCRMSLISISVIQIGTYLDESSLVPRLSHHPLAVCKNGGEKPGPFYHINDVRDRGGGGVPNWKNAFRAFSFFVLNQERYVLRFANVWNSSTWGRNYKDVGPLPPTPLSRHWHHSCDKMNRTFPLCFYITESNQKLDSGKALETRLIRTFTYLSPQNDLNGLVCLTLSVHPQVPMYLNK